MNKRDFLKNTSLLSVGAMLGFPHLKDIFDSHHPQLSELNENNEDFWQKIRSGYRLPNDFINLENGYYCIQPEEILQAHIKHLREVNLQGAKYLRTVQAENKMKMVEQLSNVAGCQPTELIITRNTTESLNTIINGFPWKQGDEAIMATHDYGSMLDMFAQNATRYGITNKMVSLPLHPISDEQIVDIYEKAITSRTKLIMVSHIINITGQILPIKKICAMARKKGVQVMVDGAHAFAHIQFKISDLDCDYYGSSLHKWLSNPLGAGFLYIKKEHIPTIWPLFAEHDTPNNNVLRLNHTGTHPVHTDLTIGDSLHYYFTLGAERKENRLRFLKNYWVDKVKDLSNVTMNTPHSNERSCAIANFKINSLAPTETAKQLLEKHKIFTVAINNKGTEGCRITPNVYTSLQELDKLVEAIKQMSA